VETSRIRPAESGVAPMERKMKHCARMESKLRDLLLDPTSASARVRSHVAECEGCRKELEELKAAMGLLDSWKAPEPSPYFLTRFEARMREQREAEPAGWLASRLARLRAGFTYGSGLHARPLAAMALTIVLLLGGGAYLGITDWNQTSQQAGQAAVVHDLQILDNNAQLLDQMEELSSSENGD